MKMLNANLLCKVEKIESKSKLTLLKEKNYKVLIVIEVDSENVKNIKEGDKVYVPKASGFDIEIDGEVREVINIKEVILIV